MSEDIAVRVVTDHVAGVSGDDWPDYHEWITLDERFRADSLGRQNPRVIDVRWTKWVCNNPDCPAWAVVSDAGIRRMIEEVSAWA